MQKEIEKASATAKGVAYLANREGHRTIYNYQLMAAGRAILALRERRAIESRSWLQTQTLRLINKFKRKN